MGKRKSITVEELADIRFRLRRGDTIRQIAESMNVYETHLRRCAHKHGVVLLDNDSARCWDLITSWCERGVKFTGADFPWDVEPGTRDQVLREAVELGWIKDLGVVKNPLGGSNKHTTRRFVPCVG